MDIKELMEKERWATEEAIIRNNVDAMNEVFAPDAVFHAYPFPDMDLPAFKQFISAMSQTFSDVQWNWEEVIIDGGTAVQRYTARMKHTGTALPIPVPPTGKELLLRGCAIYHVKDGKITEFTEFSDYLGAFMQLGVVPPLV